MGPQLEGPEGRRADGIGASVDAEEKPLSAAGRNEIAAAARTDAPVRVMILDIPADLCEIAKDLAVGTQKEMLGDHIPSL
jgi:hypothetical protein